MCGHALYHNNHITVTQCFAFFSTQSQDDVFEDSIVDFFETADVDKDGILEYTDFYSVRILMTSVVCTNPYCDVSVFLIIHFGRLIVLQSKRAKLYRFTPLLEA